MKYFVSGKDAKKIIFKEFSLLDENLIIKKTNKDGTFTFEPILSIGTFNKYDIDEFSLNCKSRGNELLYEVDKEILASSKFSDIDFTVYKELENGTYHEVVVDFEPKTIKLLEYDVLKGSGYKKDLLKHSKTVVVLPSKIDKESLYFSEKRSVIVIGDKVSERRDYLNNSRLGSDLYLMPENPEVIEEYPRYQVQLQEYDKNVYKMQKRYYYFIETLSEEERSYLNEEELILYNELTKDKKETYINPGNKENDQLLIGISIYEIESLLENNIENMPLKNLFKVYNQVGVDLIPISLEKALNSNKEVKRK